MKTITSPHPRVQAEFYVLEVDHDGVEVDFVQGIDDLLINAPDVSIDIVWDYGESPAEFPQSFLRFGFKDEMKEIPNINNSKICFRASKPGEKGRLFIVGQRN